MSTYIQNLTDYVPQIQPFQPDYNFLGNVLEAKQNRYDAGYKQISELYGTLLNSPMLRDENIAKRDEFFKMIDKDIQKISGLDLSLQQNQESAMNLFKGFYEDKDMVKDMVWTKNYQNQLARGEALKLCVDPDKCGGAWSEIAEKELHYKAQEFKKASREDALNFQDVDFAPFVNVYDKAMKYAKDMGFEMKYDQLQGGWKVTNKNGKLMSASLADAFIHKFGNDPVVQRMNRAKAYVNRTEWIANEMATSGVDELTASMAYVNRVYSGENTAKKQMEELTEKKTQISNNIALMQERIKKEGYVESLDGDFDAVMKALLEDEEITTGAETVVKNEVNAYNAAKLNNKNLKYVLGQVDDILAVRMLNQEAVSAAEHYSTLTSDRLMTADPFALASHHAKLDRATHAINKAVDWEYTQKEKLLEAGLMFFNPKTGQFEMMPTAADDKDLAKGIAPGGTTEAHEIKSAELNMQKRNKVNGEVQQLQRTYTTNALTQMHAGFNSYTATPQEKEFYRSALKDAFKGTDFDVDRFLKTNWTGQDAEILRDLTPNQQKTIYSILTEYAKDGDNVKGKPGYSFYGERMNKQYAKDIAYIDEKTKQADAFNKLFDDQAVKTGNQIAGQYVTLNEPVKAKLAQDWAKTMKVPINKAMMETDAGKKMIEEFAEAWAEANQKSFTPTDRYDIPLGGSTALPAFYPGGATKISTLTAKQTAKARAKEYLKEILPKFYEEYNTGQLAWNQVKVSGKDGGARDQGVETIGGTINMTTGGQQTMVGLDNLQTFITNTNPNTIAYTGVADEAPDGETAYEKSNTLKGFFQVLYSDLMNPSKKAAEKPIIDWYGQGVALGSPSKMGVHFRVDPRTLAAYTSTEKKPGILTEELAAEIAKNGVQVVFDKNAVSNSFTELIKITDVQALANHGYAVDINTYPDVKASVRNDNGTYIADFNLKSYTPDGVVEEKQSYNLTEAYFGNAGVLDAKAIIDVLTEQAGVFQDFITLNKNSLKKKLTK